MAPEHKTLVVGGYNALGLTTLMCGDGTNDVGALKRAHVGVAIMTGAPPPSSPASGPAAASKAKLAAGSTGKPAKSALEQALEDEVSFFFFLKFFLC